MKQPLLLILIALIVGLIPAHAQTGDNISKKEASVVDELKQKTQELLDAVASGKKDVWEKYLADGCIFSDEEGNVRTKDEVIKELAPLPKGYIGTIKMGEPKVLIQDNVIVLSHRDREDLELFNQQIVTYFQVTDSWAKQKGGTWKMVGTVVMAVPNERKPMTIKDLKKLDDYVGTYRLSSEVSYMINREGDKLFGQRTGRGKEELLILYNDVLYKRGVWRGEKVFERNAQGKIIKLLDRRDNNDLVWEKYEK